MNSDQALSKCKKLFGKTAHIELNNRATLEPEKILLLKEIEQERARIKSINLKHLKCKGYQDDTLSRLNTYRCKVGTIAIRMFFSVRGQGDSWQEAIDNAEKAIQADHDSYYKKRNTP